jgi:hypothetical protein
VSRIAFACSFVLAGALLTGCSSDSTPPQPAPPASAPGAAAGEAMSAAGLVGPWTFNGACAIELKDGALSVVNERGSRASATIQAGVMSVPEWNLTGTLHGNGKELRWSNGSTWTR